MIVEGAYRFEGPRQAVWDLLQDPDLLARALPGAQRLTRTGEDRYEGVMRAAIGPVTAGEFSVTVTLHDKVPPERFAMTLEGSGSLGFTRGGARVELREVQGGGTSMTYRAELRVGGRLAGLGQRLLDSVAKSMTRQGLDALRRELQARLAGGERQPDRSP